ncbi:MAG TPA: biopolymer transporter ExbD [Phenylobacterium sp.]|nr:biopolymer transporter ExbD [Phenylobacterium sp.]
MAGRLISLGHDRYRLNQNSEINVTPFVDVMLVLLIIFMVAMPLATVSLKLDMPPADGRAVGPPPIVVSMAQGGVLFIDDAPSSLDRLSGDLVRRIGGKDPRAQRVYVRAQRGVRYGDFVGLVSRLHRDGFHAVGLVNEAL